MTMRPLEVLVAVKLTSSIILDVPGNFGENREIVFFGLCRCLCYPDLILSLLLPRLVHLFPAPSEHYSRRVTQMDSAKMGAHSERMERSKLVFIFNVD